MRDQLPTSSHTAQPEEHRAQSPAHPIDEAAIVQALSYPRTPYFITTSLYWDCECDINHIRPAGMPACEECGAVRADRPDSRINEARNARIHVDWTDPEVLPTLDEHSAADRARQPVEATP